MNQWVTTMLYRGMTSRYADYINKHTTYVKTKDNTQKITKHSEKKQHPQKEAENC
jgi:hypothetical protein